MKDKITRCPICEKEMTLIGRGMMLSYLTENQLANYLAKMRISIILCN